MTKWKKQIDAELGSEPKFHQGLQQKILENTTTRKRRNFTYPFTLIGACFVAVLLFITWSNETPPQQQVSNGKLALNNVVQEDSVQEVYVSYFSSNEHKFFARPNTLALGMKKVNAGDMLDVSNMLRSARLTNSYGNNIYGFDVIVKFESGSEKRLRVASNVEIYDYETKLTYETDAQFSNSFQNIFGERYNTSLLFTVFLILLILSFHFVCVNLQESAP